MRGSDHRVQGCAQVFGSFSGSSLAADWPVPPKLTLDEGRLMLSPGQVLQFHIITSQLLSTDIGAGGGGPVLPEDLVRVITKRSVS